MSHRGLVDSLRFLHQQDGQVVLQVWAQHPRLGECGGINYRDDGEWINVPWVDLPTVQTDVSGKAVSATRLAPHPGSPVVSAMLDSVLAEYAWPSNPKNAARAGYIAALRLLGYNVQPFDEAATQTDPAQGETWVPALMTWTKESK